MNDMSIKIENERQLKTAQEFVEFIKEHNKRVLARRNADSGSSDDVFDIAVRMASLINTMAKELAVKQTEIDSMRRDLANFREKINELEREIRVSKDLLTIAKAVDDAK